MAHWLSKSSYLRGWQCPKALWMWKHRPDLRRPPSPQQLAIFEQGTQVGLLAQQLFPGGVDCSPRHHHAQEPALAATQEAVKRGAPAIYEATFMHEGVLAAVDILARDGDGWTLVEVKSSTSAKDQFLEDCALQYHVVQGAGTNVTGVRLLLIDNHYVRQGELEVDRLLTALDVTDEVLARQPAVRERIASLKGTLNDAMPDVPIGPQCESPYPCEFKPTCWKEVPARSVFLLSHIGKKAFELHHSGIRELKDVPEEAGLTPAQRLQVSVERSGRPHVEAGAIRDFVAGLHYPLHHLDFETFALAVPPFDGVRPYQAIPFQFSLHVEDGPGKAPGHLSFLAEAGGDPREEFSNTLLRSIRPEGDILVYNRSFEARIIKELARDLPHHASALRGLLPRLKDLALPFARHWYLDPAMNGRHSIKSVLPVLVPELRYTDLEIGSGDLASLSFAQLMAGRYTGDIQQLRNALEAYCTLDTLAMVRVLRVLRDI